MNRKIIVLNLILLVLLAWGGTELRRRWQEARRHEAEVLAKAARPVSIPTPASPPPVAPAPAAEYLDVAQKTLFSADRNPNIEIQVEAPKPEPEPPVPPMPVYHGQMAIAEPIILLSNAGAQQKGFHAGDDIGDFKILSFDREHIKFGWRGKELDRDLRALAAKDEPPQARTSNVNAAPAAANKNGKAAPQTNARNPAAPKGSNVSVIGGATNNASSAASKNNSIFGAQVGPNRLCAPADDSPAGTVKDGYKKKVDRSPMGECLWEPTK